MIGELECLTVKKSIARSSVAVPLAGQVPETYVDEGLHHQEKRPSRLTRKFTRRGQSSTPEPKGTAGGARLAE